MVGAHVRGIVCEQIRPPFVLHKRRYLEPLGRMFVSGFQMGNQTRHFNLKQNAQKLYPETISLHLEMARFLFFLWVAFLGGSLRYQEVCCTLILRIFFPTWIRILGFKQPGIMARVCHMNRCPVGVATQREDLRNLSINGVQ